MKVKLKFLEQLNKFEPNLKVTNERSREKIDMSMLLLDCMRVNLLHISKFLIV